MKTGRSVALLLFSLAIAGSALPLSAQAQKWRAYQVKGDTSYKREEYAKAIKYYTKAITLSKLKEREIYRTVYKRAVCYYSLGNYQMALKDLDLFIPQYPAISQARLMRAFIYRELDDDDQQLANLNEVMALEPSSPDLLKWRGMLYIQRDEFEIAMKDLRLARELTDDAEVETYLGICYYSLDKSDSAFTSFTRSIELDPTYFPAYLYAGSYALEQGNYALSLEYTNLALRVDSHNKEALFYKGIALVELDKVDQGCKCLNRAFYAGMDDAGDYLEEYCYTRED